jgi:hypothetical protein
METSRGTISPVPEPSSYQTGSDRSNAPIRAETWFQWKGLQGTYGKTFENHRELDIDRKIKKTSLPQHLSMIFTRKGSWLDHERRYGS